MKRIASLVPAALLLALAIPLAVPACATLPPIVQDCGREAVGGILDDVNTALATEDWRQGLAGLVSRVGGCAVDAAVKEIAGQAGARAQYDSLESTKAERAKAWLSERSGS